MNFQIGQKFTKKEGYPIEASVWCDENNAVIEMLSDGSFEIKAIPLPSPEEIEKMELEKAKARRAKEVANIKVEVDGLMFDGDEMAQSRMARAIEVANITGMKETVWVLADNTVKTVTLEQMRSALSKAMLKMGELWTKPYETERNA